MLDLQVRYKLIKREFCNLVMTYENLGRIWFKLSTRLRRYNILEKPLHLKEEIISLSKVDEEVEIYYDIVTSFETLMNLEKYRNAQDAFKRKDDIVAEAVKEYYRIHHTLSLKEIYDNIINKSKEISKMSIDPVILYFNIKRLAEKDPEIGLILDAVEKSGVKLINYDFKNRTEQKVAAFLKFYESHMHLTYYKLCEEVAKTPEMQALGLTNPLTICSAMKVLMKKDKFSSLALCRNRENFVDKQEELSREDKEIIVDEFKELYGILIFSDKYYEYFIEKYEKNNDKGLFGSVCLELTSILNRSYDLDMDSNTIVKKIEYAKRNDLRLREIVDNLNSYTNFKEIRRIEIAQNELLNEREFEQITL